MVLNLSLEVLGADRRIDKELLLAAEFAFDTEHGAGRGRHGLGCHRWLLHSILLPYHCMMLLFYRFRKLFVLQSQALGGLQGVAVLLIWRCLQL